MISQELLITEKVSEFIKRETGVSKAKIISAKTRLREDLGIDGDDAVNLFVLFQREFEVDLSSFPWDHYFNGEGSELFGLSRLVRRFIYDTKEVRRKNIDLLSINIGDLVTMVINKKWVDKV